VSASDRHIDGLTGFRALAALWVTFFHLFAMVGPKVIAIHPFGIEVELHPLITVGWVGANLFFVLSGFLLMSRLVDRLTDGEPRRAVRNYLSARVHRVFPAYWAQIMILLGVAVVTQRALPDWIGTLPLNLFMVHNLSKDAAWAINPVYWTLPIEFFFYLCLPFLAAILSRAERRGRGKWRALAFVVLGSIVLSWSYRYAMFRIFAPAGNDWLVWSINQLPGTIDQFVIGGAAGLALRWSRPRLHAWSAAKRARVSTMLLALGLAGIVGMMYFLDDIYDIFWIGHAALYTWYTVTAVFASIVLVAIVLSSVAARVLFANPVMVFLGTISYSIYLWHYPIGIWVMKNVDMAGMTLAKFSAIVIPLVIVVSAISYYAIERPFLRSAPR